MLPGRPQGAVRPARRLSAPRRPEAYAQAYSTALVCRLRHDAPQAAPGAAGPYGGRPGRGGHDLAEAGPRRLFVSGARMLAAGGQAQEPGSRAARDPDPRRLADPERLRRRVASP